MIRRLLTIAALVMAGSLLISCGNTEEPRQLPIKVPAKAAKPAAPESIDTSAGISSSIESAKLRNPFQSHIMVMKAAPEMSKKIRGPLECCEVGMFRIMAAVVGVTDAEGFALIQAPDNKRYVVRRGDILGARDGHVIKIHSKGIVVREHTRDEDGKIKSTEDIELRLMEKKI